MEWSHIAALQIIEHHFRAFLFAGTLHLVDSIVAILQSFYLRSKIVLENPWPLCTQNQRYCVFLMNACIAIVKFQDTQALLVMK